MCQAQNRLLLLWYSNLVELCMALEVRRILETLVHALGNASSNWGSLELVERSPTWGRACNIYMVIVEELENLICLIHHLKPRANNQIVLGEFQSHLFLHNIHFYHKRAIKYSNTFYQWKSSEWNFTFLVQSIGLVTCFRCCKSLNCSWQLIMKRIKCYCELFSAQAVNE